MSADKLRAQAAVIELRARWPYAGSIRSHFDDRVEVLFDIFPIAQLTLWRYVDSGNVVQWACTAQRFGITANADGDTATASAEAGLRALAALIRADADAVEARANAEGGAQ